MFLAFKYIQQHKQNYTPSYVYTQDRNVKSSTLLLYFALLVCVGHLLSSLTFLLTHIIFFCEISCAMRVSSLFLSHSSACLCTFYSFNFKSMAVIALPHTQYVFPRKFSVLLFYSFCDYF